MSNTEHINGGIATTVRADVHEAPKEASSPTLNSTVQTLFSSLLAEIKSMNQKMDVITAPVDLDDNADLEDGEIGQDEADDDAESIVSLGAKVDKLTQSTEDKSNALQDIAEDLDLSEKTGGPIDEELAKIITSLLKDKMQDEKTQKKVETYPRPKNIEGLRTPRVNPLIWSSLPAQARTQDSKFQKTEQSLVASIAAMTRATDMLVQRGGNENKELLKCLTDGIALSMNCLHDLNNTRRQAMKKDLHRDYAALCNTSTIPSSSEYLFGDLSKLTKDISEANKLTKKVNRPPQSHQGRGRKFQSSHYGHNGQKHRGRFAPYSYSRPRSDHFLPKGRSPAMKSKKESKQ